METHTRNPRPVRPEKQRATGNPSSHPEVPPGRREDTLGFERLVFFSDAVFAIAITLLALEIHLPAGETAPDDARLFTALLEIWPRYLAYALSFLVIGTFWIGHHRKFRHIRQYDRRLILLNLLLLMSVAFIPFPTTLISDSTNRTATIFYALSMTCTGLLSAGLWWYASSRASLIDPSLPPAEVRREGLRSLIIPGVFLLSIALALIHSDTARFFWLLLVPAAFVGR
ncbi:MAG TPA: DUF1211 domain-containing protein [Anaerolinea thermolimosa]|uniref:DUF1211 domain-containing protein n=1 Tax=Anaerolinea thermolimosa TaxID=229919 RepID=A0A3D1JI82_9CHLR|nr:DUF1211 domain-containing protein [Anaerolinea thermolimosa]